MVIGGTSAPQRSSNPPHQSKRSRDSGGGSITVLSPVSQQVPHSTIRVPSKCYASLV